MPEHFIARHDGDTFLMSDNSLSDPGEELYVEVAEGEPETDGRILLTERDVRNGYGSITREDAERLRDFLNKWLGEDDKLIEVARLAVKTYREENGPQGPDAPVTDEDHPRFKEGV